MPLQYMVFINKLNCRKQARQDRPNKEYIELMIDL
jgi:hypothetical protein